MVRHITGKEIPYEIVPRRLGDIAECYAAVDIAREKLGWESACSIEESITNGWKFRVHTDQEKDK